MPSLCSLLAVSILTLPADAPLELTASDAAEGDEFGFAVAVSGDLAVVGAPFDDDGGSGSGSAYVYQRVGAQWVQQAKLTASDAAAYSFFGHAVGIDGDTVVVGAPEGGGLAGKVYVFQRTNDTWTEQARLVVEDPQRRVVAFGSAVAIESDRLVVGVPYAEAPLMPSGSAYVFRRAGAAWSQESVLAPAADVPDDRFGSSVAISGDLIAIGAPETGFGQGAAYTFQYDGLAWQEGTKLTVPDTSLGPQFGAAIALDGGTLVVGAPVDRSLPYGSGSAFVFQRVGEGWVRRAKITATDVAGVDGFGSSVAVRGQNVAVVALQRAYLFSPAGDTWLEQGRFVADVPFGLGSSIDLEALADAVTVVFGAPSDDDAGPHSGSAFVFEFAPGFHTLSPCRAVDTRGFQDGGALLAGQDRSFELQGTCEIPTTAKAVSVNITVTGATQAGHLRLHPAGTPVPTASSINYVSGQTRSSNAIMALNGGAMAVFVGQAAGSTHFIVDVNGYFQ